MPYGYDPTLTSFTSIMTSSSDCSGEGTKRTYVRSAPQHQTFAIELGSADLGAGPGLNIVQILVDVSF